MRAPLLALAACIALAACGGSDTAEFCPLITAAYIPAASGDVLLSDTADIQSARAAAVLLGFDPAAVIVGPYAICND